MNLVGAHIYIYIYIYICRYVIYTQDDYIYIYICIILLILKLDLFWANSCGAEVLSSKKMIGAVI